MLSIKLQNIFYYGLNKIIKNIKQQHKHPLITNIRLLESMLSNSKETVTRQEIKSLLFANPEKTMLTEAIRGTSKKDGNYHYQQTWIVCPCNVPTLNNK